MKKAVARVAGKRRQPGWPNAQRRPGSDLAGELVAVAAEGERHAVEGRGERAWNNDIRIDGETDLESVGRHG